MTSKVRDSDKETKREPFKRETLIFVLDDSFVDRMKDTLEALSRVVTIDLCCSVATTTGESSTNTHKGKRRVIRSCGYRAYYEAWFVWWFRFGSRRGERSRLESRLSRSTGSDGG
jgi:hypothetical protein